MVLDRELGSARIEAGPAREIPAQVPAQTVWMSVDSVVKWSIVVATLLSIRG
jgi:hypothetical protein